MVWRPVPTRWWLATASFPVVAAGPAANAAGVDPARAAHDVFQDPVFWWKRLEPRSISTSWLESILSAVLDLLGRIARAIYELILRFLRSLFGVFTGDASILTAVVWLLVAALIAWLIWRIYPVIVRWLSQRAPAPSLPEQVTLAEASELFEQAGQAFGDGHYAESIRLALLALIARLQRQGLLRYDPARTNREYQRELRPRMELATSFGQLARIYERVWYGRVPAGRAEAEQAISLCGSLINREDLAPE
jgi:hypothetical protein